MAVRERSSLNQSVQVAPEATPGVAPSVSPLGFVQLRSIGIEPNITVEKDNFRPIGDKFNALSILGKEWAEASISGRGSYTELQYLLASVITNPIIKASLPAAGTNTWIFAPSTRDDDKPVTYTVEHGTTTGESDRFTYGLVTEIGMTFNRSSVEVSGSMMARALERIESPDEMASGTTDVKTKALIPITPQQVCVYLADTYAGLAAGKLTRLISADFSLGSRFGPVWVLDCGEDSFVNHIETEPDLSMTLTMQADGTGMGLLDDLRSGDTKFIRIEAIGPSIGATATPYKLTIDMAGKISDTGGFSDQDGVYAIEYSFIGVHEPTLVTGEVGDPGHALVVKLVTGEATPLRVDV